MVACFRQGFVVLPVHRAAAPEGPRAAPRRRASRALVVGDERNARRAGATPAGTARRSGRRGTSRPSRAAAARRARRPSDPCLITFTSRHRGRAEGGAPRPALPARPAPAGRALARARAGRARRGARPPSGWSKSARNVFIAPVAARRRRAAARRALRPARAPRAARARARRRALHGADRVPRDRQARDAARRSRACAGSSRPARRSNPEVLRAWHEATGLWIRDGYGQTETGQLTGMPLGDDGAARARWACRCRASALDVVDGELVLDPGDRPDVLPALPRRTTPATAGGRGAPATA